MPRVYSDIDEKLFEEFKHFLLRQKTSMTKYIEKLVKEALKKEKK